MDSSAMKSSLRLRLNDPSTIARFDDDALYRALNDAQLEVFESLKIADLSEFEEPVVDLSAQDGITTTSIYTRLDKTNAAIFNPNAVRFVSGKYRNSTTNVEYWFNLLPSSDLWKLKDNLLYADSYKNAVLNDTKKYFYIYPAKPSGYVIDLNYLRAPADISDEQDCEFKTTLHSLIVRCAEFILKNKPDMVTTTLEKYTQDLVITRS